MKTDSDCALLQIENLCNLLGGQLFHIVEHEDNPQRRRDAQDGLMQQMRRGMRRLAAHAPAAIACDSVEPGGQCLRIVNLDQMLKGTREHLLHGVFGIFRMPTDLHAEGIDRILKQPYRFFNCFRSIAPQQLGGSDQFWSHRLESSKSV